MLPNVVAALSPDTPIDLVASAGQQPVIARITWDRAPDSTPARYRVYVSQQADGPYAWSEDTTNEEFDFQDGLGGFTYYFRVTAFNSAGEESDFAQAGPVRAAWAASPHVSATTTSTTCTLCHSAHTGSSTLLSRQELATSSPEPTAVCYPCHDGRVPLAANVITGSTDSFALSSGHDVDKPKSGSLVQDCSSCHGAHLSASAKPMLSARTVNGKSVASDGPAWCEACHDSQNSWYGSDYPTTSDPSHDASGYPTSGTWPGPDTYGNGSNAHRLIPESTQTVETGASVTRSQGDCRYCHAAHKGANKYDGLKTTFRPSTPSTLASDQADGTYAALCFTCHGSAVPAGFTSAATDIESFATTSSDSAGHRILTSGGTLPVGAPLPCYDCHNPHGSERSNQSMLSDERGGSLETSSAAGVRHFCFTCHSTADNETGWDSGSHSYTAVGSSKIEGIPRSGGALKLPELSVHDQADTTSCESCHGNSYAPGGQNVHDPARMGGFDPQAHVSASGSGVIDLGLDDADHWDGDGPYVITVDCSQCHGTALLGIHDNDCATCHSSSDGAVISAIGAGDTKCTACHSNPHATVSHQAVHDAGKCDCHGLGATTQAGDVTIENCGACHTFAGVVDTTPPTTATDVLVSYVGAATVHLTALDLPLGGSGVAHTYYILDGGPQAEGGVVNIPAPSTGTASHVLEFWSVDGAGNSEPLSSRMFTVSADSVAPVSSSAIQANYWEGVYPFTWHYVYSLPDGNLGTDWTGVTLALTSTDNGTYGVRSITYVLDGGQPVVQSPWLDGSRWVVQLTVPSGTSPHMLAYWADDFSGNIETTKVVNFTTTVDATPPTTTCSAVEGHAYVGSQTFSLIATDNAGGSGADAYSYKIDGGTSHDSFGSGGPVSIAAPSSGSATHTITYYSRDKVYNFETPKSVTFTVSAPGGPDTTPPSTTSSFNPLAGAVYNSDRPVTLTAADNTGGSGVKTTYYEIDGGPWLTGVSFMVSGDGMHTFSYYSVDNSNNTESAHTSNPFRIDTVAPVTTSIIASGTTYAGSQTFTLNATDAGSGVADTSWQLDSTTGSWTSGTTVHVTAPSSGTETHTLYWHSQDNAGNVEATHSVSFNVAAVVAGDTTPPTTTASFNPAAGSVYNSDPAVTLAAVDDPGGTGVKSTHFRVDGGAWASGTSFTVSGDGLHTFSYYSTDNSDNSETTHTSNQFRIDTTAPVTTSDVTSGTTYSGAQTFALTPTDAGSGVAETSWQLDSTSGAWTHSTSVPVPEPSSGTASHTLYFYSRDNADNSEAVQSVAFSVAVSTTGTQRFSYTGAVQTFVVPAGVTQLSVEMYGASGGNVVQYDGAGGLGGSVEAVLPVTPGQVLTLRVGGKGGDGEGSDSSGGWPNGGDGYGGHGAAGGGSTSIGTDSAILVEAGAGGGAGDGGSEYDPYCNGGDGGSQGWIAVPCGNQPGGSDSCGGGGGWNGGAGSPEGDLAGADGGTSYIALGVGTVTPGVRSGNGSIALSWALPQAGVSDTTPPTTTSSFSPDVNAVYNTARDVTLNAVDDFGGSGVSSTYFNVDAGPFIAGNSFTVSGDGMHEFSYYSVDNSNNTETVHASNQFRIDTVPPVTTCNIVSGTTYTGDQSFTLTPTDTNGSGVASTAWQLDSTSGPWTTGTFVSIAAPASGTASHTLYWYSRDIATNTEGVKSASFRIAAVPVPDTTPPTTTSSFNPLPGAAYNSDRAVTLSATDNTGGTGVKATYYRIDSGAFTPGTSFSVIGDGLHTFSYYSVDNSDNAEAPQVSSQFRIDTVAPVTTSDVASGTTYPGAQTFTLAPTDDGSGVAETSWQLDSTSGTWTSGTSVGVAAPSSGIATHTLYWYSRDNASNTETVKSVDFFIASVAGSSGTQTFPYTGSVQTFVVPSGVAEVTLDLYGGAGGDRSDQLDNGCYGGLGGYVHSTMPVTPGQVLRISVGGQGEDGAIASGGWAVGGWPNGGDVSNPGYGSAGGGSSFVAASDGTVLLEAGGGGGAGDGNGPGGAGGVWLTDLYGGYVSGGGQHGGNGDAGGGGGWTGGAQSDSGDDYAGEGGTSWVDVLGGQSILCVPGQNPGNGSVTIGW